MEEKSIISAKYFLTLIDYFSLKLFVYFLISNVEVSGHSDNGLEYFKHSLQDILNKKM